MGHTYEEHASLHLPGSSPCHLSRMTVCFYSSGMQRTFIHSWAKIHPQTLYLNFFLPDTMCVVWLTVSFWMLLRDSLADDKRPLVQLIHKSQFTLWITCHTVWERSQSKSPVLCCDLILVVLTACPLSVGLLPTRNASITRLLCTGTHSYCKHLHLFELFDSKCKGL